MKALLLAILSLSALPALAQDPAPVWKTLEEAPFDPQKVATVNGLTVKRDRIQIRLESGWIAFTRSVEGIVFGAAFRGQGRLTVDPRTPLEGQQLARFTEQTKVDMEFSEAVFSFTDRTFDEVASQVTWAASPVEPLANLYRDRQKDRENSSLELLPRLFKGVLSQDRERTALFFAELKTNDEGWVRVSLDALEPEEVSVSRWTAGRGFESWLSFPLGHRSVVDAYRDPLAKEDVQKVAYRVDATVTGSEEFSAVTRVSMESRVAGERVLLFGLDANLRIQSVRDAQGHSLVFFQPRDPKDRFPSYGDYAAVVLPQPTQPGQPLMLEFAYEGKRLIRKVGIGVYFCQSFGWYPTRPNSFAQRFDFDLRFRSPKRYTFLATGNKTSETTDGEWTISEWQNDVPLTVAGFAFGDFKVQSEKVGDLDVEIYATKVPDDIFRSIELIAGGATNPRQGAEGGMPSIGSLSPALLAKNMSVEMANTLRVFEKYFGPYPFKRLAVTNIPYAYGQGWPMLIYLSAISFIDSTQRQALGITDHVQLTDFFRAHESSHQWWGHRVSWKSYHDQWLSEGFAQFSGNLYVQFRRDYKEYLNRIRGDRRELYITDRKGNRYESVGPVWMGWRLSSSDSPAAYSLIVYNKGGLILHMLRMLFFDPRSQNPEERFIQMMRDFCQTHHNRAASTEDFKAIVEKYMPSQMDMEGNGKADWFFRQYVYGTGIPEYSFNYRLEPVPDGKWKVTATVRRTGVPDNWMDPLPVYVHMNKRSSRIGWIIAYEGTASIEFLLPSKPDKVSINDNEDILAEVKQ